MAVLFDNCHEFRPSNVSNCTVCLMPGLLARWIEGFVTSFATGASSYSITSPNFQDCTEKQGSAI